MTSSKMVHLVTRPLHLNNQTTQKMQQVLSLVASISLLMETAHSATNTPSCRQMPTYAIASLSINFRSRLIVSTAQLSTN